MTSTTKAVLYSPAKEFETHEVDLFASLPEIGHIIKRMGRRYPVAGIEWAENTVGGKDYLSPIIIVGRQVV